MSTAGEMDDAKLKEALITFEKLQDLEDDFEEVDLEMIRQQTKLTAPLYVKRQQVIEKIPQFWATVFEQAPHEIDEFIQPSDSAVLVNALTNLTVDRFELATGGDPRSVSFKFEFKENDYFENKVLEKKFWWRFHVDGWGGLVSEPVEIQWKKGKDLTNGMLALAKTVFDEDKAGKGGDTPALKELKAKMDEVGFGDLSFFAWFGFRGRKVSEAEGKEGLKKYEERRAARKAGKETEDDDDDDMDEDEDDEEWENEIFPSGDDIAICIADDLWPSAIKYFTNAQEEDGSDIEFESDEEMDGDEAPPLKKVKA